MLMLLATYPTLLPCAEESQYPTTCVRCTPTDELRLRRTHRPGLVRGSPLVKPVRRPLHLRLLVLVLLLLDSGPDAAAAAAGVESAGARCGTVGHGGRAGGAALAPAAPAVPVDVRGGGQQG